MLGRLIEGRRQPPWSGLGQGWLNYKVLSLGGRRLLKRHLIRLAWEDYYECQRLVKEWM